MGKTPESSLSLGFPRTLGNYVEVLKPRESLLLTFIGVCAALIAAGLGKTGYPLGERLSLTLVTILLGSAGVNGLTNYLDRELDARMERTRHRPLPSRRIYPPTKALPLTIGLTLVGMGLAWLLHPLCFAVSVIGTIAAVTWRKRMTCVFPQGTIASCAPVLIGWFAFEPRFSLPLALLCVLIGVWIPLHVWSVMISHRQEYLKAGISFFPLNWEAKDAVKVLLAIACLLYAISIGLYFSAPFGLLYLTIANILGIIVVYASARLVVSCTSNNVWKVYKLSAFPYLGLLFLAMSLDLWL